MKINRKGNVTIILLPIVFIMILIILLILAFVYSQILINIYDVKSNMFYIAQSSINMENLDKLVYRDYNLNEGSIKDTVDCLLKQNFITNNEVGIVDIQCADVKINYSETEVKEHTNNKYNVPIMCVKVRIVFNPVISIIGKNVAFYVHEDIKLSLLQIG